MPGAGCPLLCTKHLNKRIKILSIKIAQDGNKLQVRRTPQSPKPHPQKTEGSKKGAPYEGDKTPQYPVGPWRMGAGAGCGPAAGRVQRCIGCRCSRRPQRRCRPKLRQQPTHPRCGGAGRPDRPHHRPVRVGKERFGRVGGRTRGSTFPSMCPSMCRSWNATARMPPTSTMN